MWNTLVGDSTKFATPSTLISEALGLSKKSIDECLVTLEQRDQFIFLIVDEIDQVYTSLQNEEIRLKVLMELTELGSQRYGRALGQRSRYIRKL